MLNAHIDEPKHDGQTLKNHDYYPCVAMTSRSTQLQ